MNYSIDYYDEKLQEWLDDLPVGIQASFTRLTELLILFGADLHLPFSRALGNGLFELRLKGKEGIARVFYCMLLDKKLFFCTALLKKRNKYQTKN